MSPLPPSTDAEPFATFVDALRHHAHESPQRLAFAFLDNGQLPEASRWTFADLERRALACAQALGNHCAAGDRALILLPPGLDFIGAFFGCLYAGVVAVPAYPPQDRRNAARLRAIIQESQAKVAFGDQETIAQAAQDDLAGVHWLVADGLAEQGVAAAWQPPELQPQSLAYLQFTSGSTGDPKGVMVSHRNLLVNCTDLAAGCPGDRRDWRLVSWLPPFHDLGLLFSILQPVFLGVPCFHMSPAAFIHWPVRWLRALSELRATHTAAPNFAFDYCVRKVPPAARRDLDLSRLLYVLNGSEPVRAGTLLRFADAFGPCGYRQEAMHPAFGMAEATGKVTSGRAGVAPRLCRLDAAALAEHRVVIAEGLDSAVQVIVSCGRSDIDTEVLIVHPETGERCAGDEVGEIWLRGRTIAQGYWQRPAATEETFHAWTAEGTGPCLRSGDLGFVHDGELFVTGRVKDLLIVRGRNHYPQDVESSAENSHPLLRRGCGIAFQVSEQESIDDGEPRLVIVHEVEKGFRPEQAKEVMAALGQGVQETHGLTLDTLVLIEAGSLLKTSSGKLRRRATRQAFLAAELRTLATVRQNTAAGGSEPLPLDHRLLRAASPAERRQLLADDLRHTIAHLTGLPTLEDGASLGSLGLDSLRAAELQHRLERRLGLRFPAPRLLEHPTLGELAAQGAEMVGRAARPEEPAAQKEEQVADPDSAPALLGLKPVAAQQRSLWFLHRLDPLNEAYNLAFALAVRSPLDPFALTQALQALVDRHGSLRTLFHEVEGEPWRKEQPSAPLAPTIEETSGLEPDALQARLSEEIHRPYDLATGPLFRVLVLLRGERDSILLLGAHHIVTDFWSFGILLDELSLLYRGARDNVQVPLPPAPSFDRHVRRQQRGLLGPRGDELRRFWHRQLAGAPAALELPVDRPRPARWSTHGAALAFGLDKALTEGLKHQAQDHGTTLYSLLLAAFGALLHQLSGQDDLVVGSPAHGRGDTVDEDTVGFFVNPLALRFRFTPENTWADLLAQSRRTVLDALAHHDHPLACLVEELAPHRDPARSPIFQVLFALQRTQRPPGLGPFALRQAGARLHLRGLELESVAVPTRATQFDLSLMMAERADGHLGASFEFSRDLFDATTIQRHARLFCRLLRRLSTAEPNLPLSQLAQLPAVERHQLCVEWNDTALPRPATTLSQLLDTAAEGTPDRIALALEEHQLTYQALHREAAVLAHRLSTLGAAPEMAVGILMERSLELMVALLAVLKAGATVLPLDPDLPPQRLQMMLEDAKPLVILQTSHHEIAGSSTPSLVVSPPPRGERQHTAGEWRMEHARPTQAEGAAYTLFTSGSTGRPKGAVNSQGAIVNRLLWMQETYQLTAEDRVLQKTPTSFDVSIWELFWPLVAGARLVLARPGGQRDNSYLAKTVVQHGITTLHFVPSLLRLFLEEATAPACAIPLRRLVVSGEALPTALAQRCAERLPGVRLDNLYGPTEAAIDVSFWTCPPAAVEPIPIGRPIANLRLQVLDDDLRPRPMGAAGELFLAGAGLGRGYLGRPGQTAERFLPAPRLSAPQPDQLGARLYRSGDRARVRADGAVEFLGRVDHQVKIRGVRIELGEIEATLISHPAVAQAVAAVHADSGGSEQLWAWVAPTQNTVEPEELRQFLRRSLSEAMVPAGFVSVREFPLTASGKIDRKALPPPPVAGPTTSSPRSVTEELVAGIWQEVLNTSQIGLEDDFFQLGGHSLLATRVLARVRQTFAVELPVATTFEARTVARLAARIDQESKQNKTPLPPLEPWSSLAPPEEPPTVTEHPLSFAQERLWFLDRLEGSAARATYNIPLAVALTGHLEATVLAQALHQVVRRHEALRTSFRQSEGPPVALVSPPTGQATSLPCVDLDALPKDFRRPETSRQLARLTAWPFDLEACPAARFLLLREGAGTQVLLVVLHHILADGWSLEVLLQDLAAFLGGGQDLAPLVMHYSDYSRWQRRWLSAQVQDRQIEYWRQQLADLPVLLTLPADRPRPPHPSFRGHTVTRQLRQHDLAALRALNQRHGGTFFMALLAVYAVLLARLADQLDVTIGTPVAGRRDPQLEALIGCFVNTLVLRADLSGRPHFEELLKRLRATALAAYDHQDVPFEQVVEALAPNRDLSHTPLFQAMLVLEQVPRVQELPNAVHVEPVTVDSGVAKFDLILFVREGTDGHLSARFEANRDLFNTTTVARLAAGFQRLLRHAVEEPQRPVAELDILSAAERHQVLQAWNDTERPVVGEFRLHRLFSQRAQVQPQAIALVGGCEHLSYGELAQRSTTLARGLQRHGIAPGDPVAVAVERSPRLVMALLAVLEAGACYVPLEPSQPDARLLDMVRQAKARAVLATPVLAQRLADAGLADLILPWQDLEGCEVSASPPEVSPEHHAYTMFTSGSTGRPKGVMVQHRPAAHLVRFMNRTFKIGRADRLLWVTSIGFDLSVYDLFGTLAAGATLELTSQGEARDAQALTEKLLQRRITVWDSAPAACEQLLPFLPSSGAGGQALRRVFLSGDWIPPALPAAVKASFPAARVVALGGTTENVVWSNYHLVRLLAEPWPSVPYGVAIDQARLMVLDGALEPSPLGVPGALLISGLGMAMGYTGQPALTAQRFLPDPFAPQPGAVMYHTGDRARWRAGALVEFLGRLDHQVKIRGFRIELEEVEAALARHPRLAGARVLAEAAQGTDKGQSQGPGADLRLVAYLIAPPERPDAQELHRFLAQHLPEYMLPSAWVVVAAIPLTRSGKLDRQELRRLAEQPGARLGRGTLDDPPRDHSPRRRPAAPMAQLLAELFAEILDLPEVGIEDNFFALGGHSLLATQLVGRLRHRLDLEVPLRTVFDAPSPQALAQRVVALERPAFPPLVATEHESTQRPLSSAQRRLWFLAQLEGLSPTYNLSAAFGLEGAVHHHALAQAFAAVVARHEVLRGRFEVQHSEPLQVIDPAAVTLPLPVVDLAGLPQPSTRARALAEAEALRPFDLATDPVLRVCLLRLAPARFVLLVSLHHIAGDAWSVGLLMDEVSQAYGALRAHQEPRLPALAVQYADFAQWQGQWLETAILARQGERWKERLADIPTLLELPTDRPRPPVQSFLGRNHHFPIHEELLNALRQLSRSHTSTLFMTLLAAFAVLLSRLSGHRDLVIGSPIANRSSAESEGLIGFFVNTLALRLRCDDDPSFSQLLGQSRDTALFAYANQDLPFERLVELLAPARHLQHAPIFQVMLALENTPQRAFDLPGIDVERWPLEGGVARFDLTLGFSERPNALLGLVEYSTRLFDGTTIERWTDHLTTLLHAITAGPHLAVSELPLLNAAARQQVLYEWNDTQDGGPLGQGVLKGFFHHVAHAPDTLALVWSEGTLTYGCLALRARRLAGRLQERGVEPEVLVTSRMPRSPELPLALLGTFIAGGVYVPLDPTAPAHRTAALLERLRPAIRIEHASTAAADEAPSPALLTLDATSPDHDAPLAGDLVGWPRHLAYIIFTSGSTGEPKGVEIEHRSLANQVGASRVVMGFQPGQRSLSFFAPAFDASVWETLLPLTSGVTLVHGGPEEMLPGEPLLDTLRRQRINNLALTPSGLASLPTASLPALGFLHTGGEVLSQRLVERWAVGRPLLNIYGPTEVTIASTASRCSPGSSAAPAIGRPLANLSAHGLDRGLAPVPVGVAGELHLAGVGLARGYFRNPAATATAFVPNPFSPHPGGRLYKTGDRIRLRADGEMEFLGRVDHQVKVRGFRIEVGEIEVALCTHPAVEKALVMTVGDPPDLVVCWQASVDGLKADALRAHLTSRLPDYMVPDRFLRVEEWPLTSNGKVDRTVLGQTVLKQRATLGSSAHGPDVGPALASASLHPSPHQGRHPHTTNQPSRAGRALRQRLTDLWCEVLERDTIDPAASFFDLGGHSLLLARLHVRLQEGLGQEIPLLDLFRHPSVNALALHLEGQITPTAAPALAPLDAAEPIAIIGMAGRFPGADDVETLWQNLAAGVESISSFTAQELRAAGTPEDLLSHPDFVRAGGVLGDLAAFDAEFFGIGPREAELLDPQFRLFLEVTWQALESAGYVPENSGGAVGLFAGAALNTYLIRSLLPNRQVMEGAGEFQVAIANDKDFLPTYTSYKLNLAGPSVNVQTACSTSLVAVHLACQSLRQGECALALAGGVSVRVPQPAGYLHQEGMIFSPDGHCRPFDAQAAGTVAGDGVGLVVLKPLARAQADGDAIRAVIRGSAINNDGANKIGFTAPGMEGQTAVIVEALRRANVRAQDIGYVEAHGTGTPLGDPIEVAALARAFEGSAAGPDSGQRPPCALGSVKSNVGHLNTAAGVTGLIKTVLSLEQRTLLPSLHYEHPNPEIDFASTPLVVNAECRPWPRRDGSRRAGVSSFGIGGTNAHLVLEEAPDPLPRPPEDSPSAQLLILSARSARSLEESSDRLAAHLRSHPQLNPADVAFTLAVGRRAFHHRRALLLNDPEKVIQRLTDPAAARRESTEFRGEEPTPAAFLFPGQGTQHLGMGEELYREQAVFRHHLERSARILEPHLAVDLCRLLYPAPEHRARARRQLARTAIAQPALVAVELATAELWRSWGVEPWALLGHSLGEYSAASLAGVFELEELLALVARRGQLMEDLPGGAMLAVQCPRDEVAGVLDHDLEVAAIDGPSRTVLTGTSEAVGKARARFEQGGIASKVLATDRAFHSSIVEPILEPFGEALTKARRSAPRIPFLSNLSGTWIRADQATDPKYWLEHLRHPVRFAEGVERLLTDAPHLGFLECGPGRSLSSLVRRHPQRNPQQSAHPCLAPAAGTDGIRGVLGRLWTAGVEVDWPAFYGAARRRRVPLPSTPFDRQHYWIAPPTQPAQIDLEPAARRREDPSSWLYEPSWQRAPRARSEAEVNPGDVLVVGDALGEALLKDLAHCGWRTSVVTPGEAFKRPTQLRYELDPRRAEDWEALLEDLPQRPHAVLYLLPLELPAAPTTGRLEEELAWQGEVVDLTFFGLTGLARALGRHPADSPCRLLVFSQGLQEVNGDESLEPASAGLLGAVHVIPQEQADLPCRSIDLAADCGEWTERVLTELGLSGGPRVVAWRGRHRWVRDFVPSPLLVPARKLVPWGSGKEPRTCLVTGGLGGLGAAIAHHLAVTTNTRLVLVGRTMPPTSAEERQRLLEQSDAESPLAVRLRRLEELEKHTEVLALAADVADRQQMAEALATARRHWGRIDGVLHTAGLAAGSTLETARRAEALRVLRPKIAGIRILAHLLREDPPDFMVLFSSLAAVAGGFGQADYSAANAFLDAFSVAAGEIGVPMISLAWDTWREVGMAVDLNMPKHLRDLQHSELAQGLSTREALDLLDRILAAATAGQAPRHLLVSTLPLVPRLEEMEKRHRQRIEGPVATTARHQRPSLSTPYATPQGETEQQVAEIWAELLGYTQVGLDDNFFDLGGDSLVATQVATRLRQQQGLSLPVRALFEQPTVAGLAARIGAERLRAKAATPTVGVLAKGEEEGEI